MKKIIFLFVLFFSFQSALAQVMSDKQIIEFILSEQKKGSSQRTIAAKLMQRGVSAARLKEIKDEYNAKNATLGADDANVTGLATVDRQRQEETFRLNRDLHGATREEKLDVYEAEVSAFAMDSAKIQENDAMRVFGRDIFNNELLTFEPALNIATPF